RPGSRRSSRGSGGPGSVRKARGAPSHRGPKGFGQQHPGARRRSFGPHWPRGEGGDSSPAPSPQGRYRRSPQRGDDSLEEDRGWRIEDRGSIKKEQLKRAAHPRTKFQEPRTNEDVGIWFLEFGSWGLLMTRSKS